MLNTKFNKEELTAICQIMKKHGTDCATLVDVLKTANVAAPNDSISTFKHVRLMKEFGVLEDKYFLCHQCVMDAINHHADTCAEYIGKMRICGSDDENITEREKFNAYLPCPQDHYDYSKCKPAVWMVDGHKINLLEHKAAEKEWEEGRRDNIMLERGEPIFKDDIIVGHEKDKRRFDHTGRTNWLEMMFPDIDVQVRHNPWMGLFCEEHVRSMKPYSDKITDYL